MSPSPKSSKTDQASTAQTRTALSADRVIAGAIVLADEIGIEQFTIRKLAAELDAKPMSIYHHIPNKEAIIDGMIDFVFSEITSPPQDLDWKSAMRLRANSAREALARHRWAAPLMESRATPGAATLQHHEDVLKCFRQAGFSIAMTAHAYALIDAYIYGFALQEANLPATGGNEMTELVDSIFEPLPMGTYPHLMEFASEHVMAPGYDFGEEFGYGLELILDGLAAAK